MPEADRPLIAGAGPVGLAAAVFLAHRGTGVRIVEKELKRLSQSRALAVNPRTLAILESVGLTERMLAIGRKITAASMWQGKRQAATIDLSRLGGKYPFMLALSQAATERLLEERLGELGGTVERGTQLVDCASEGDGVTASLATPQGDQTHRAAWLLAADGARSTVRGRLDMDFAGSTFKQKWELADAAVDTPLDENRAHAFFLPRGEFQFMLRVVDPLVEPTVPGPLWRLIGNRPGLVDRLAMGRVIGSPVWSSSFAISHRIVGAMSSGRAYFAGDSAHIHSPIGARGMNLGIEDAWVFSQLALGGQLDRYNDLRRPVDHQVVRRVAFVSRIIACNPRPLRFVRRLIPLVLRLGAPSSRLMAIATGTDHSLPDLGMMK